MDSRVNETGNKYRQRCVSKQPGKEFSEEEEDDRREDEGDY